MSIVEQIKSRATLHDIASLLGIHLPARVGLKFRSPFRVDKNPSCSLYQRNGELRFRDWSAHVDVDLIGCYALARGVSNGDAIRELARELRIEQGDCIAESDNRRLGRESFQPAEKASSPRPMPRQVADSWIEGTSYLARQARLQERIAEWRGWPTETIARLAEDGSRVTRWLARMPFASSRLRGKMRASLFPRRGHRAQRSLQGPHRTLPA